MVAACEKSQVAFFCSEFFKVTRKQNDYPAPEVTRAERIFYENNLSGHRQRQLQDLLNDLREHGLDLNLPIAFAGGGAELLKDHLTSSDANVVAILDRFANADGYKALVKR